MVLPEEVCSGGLPEHARLSQEALGKVLGPCHTGMQEGVSSLECWHADVGAQLQDCVQDVLHIWQMLLFVAGLAQVLEGTLDVYSSVPLAKILRGPSLQLGSMLWWEGVQGGWGPEVEICVSAGLAPRDLMQWRAG